MYIKKIAEREVPIIEQIKPALVLLYELVV